MQKKNTKNTFAETTSQRLLYKNKSQTKYLLLHSIANFLVALLCCRMYYMWKYSNSDGLCLDMGTWELVLRSIIQLLDHKFCLTYDRHLKNT